MQARDFYDLWYLLEEHGIRVDDMVGQFKNKCNKMGISPLEFPGKLAQRLPQFKGRWHKSLADQIKDLPDFDEVEREMMRHLRKFKVTLNSAK